METIRRKELEKHLTKVREAKMKYVNEQDYEMAAAMRNEERTLIDELDQGLWEILVPASIGKTKFTHEHHKEWDAFVKSLSGGLTILKVAKGYWYNPDGIEFEDRIIPVRISCSTADINKIIDFTITHYDQEAVMCYQISDTVIIKHKEDL